MTGIFQPAIPVIEMTLCSKARIIVANQYSTYSRGKQGRKLFPPVYAFLCIYFLLSIVANIVSFICNPIQWTVAIFKKAVWKRKHMTKLSFAWSKSLQNMTYYVDSWQAAGPYVNEHHWV